MTLKELEKQVTTLADIEAIKSLQNEYIFYLLNRQWTEITDFFTDDAFVLVSRLEKA
jgi:hypothetical protein